jgi:hypothetical protein
MGIPQREKIVKIPPNTKRTNNKEAKYYLSGLM